MKKPRMTREGKLRNLRKASGLAMRDRIRRRLAMPMEQRTGFLRKRIGPGSSCLEPDRYT
ncbi:MAG: hypothetical protein KGN36_05350 [Acidobacteriota bacterium]|nr:hypothetical protein [Acidobacteriota bacterium]